MWHLSGALNSPGRSVSSLMDVWSCEGWCSYRSGVKSEGCAELTASFLLDTILIIDVHVGMCEVTRLMFVVSTACSVKSWPQPADTASTVRKMQGTGTVLVFLVSARVLGDCSSLSY